MPRAYKTPKQVSVELDIPERTVYRLCASGQLPSYRVGGRWRIDPDFEEENAAEIQRQMREGMKKAGW